jgi:hypothetical protein
MITRGNLTNEHNSFFYAAINLVVLALVASCVNDSKLRLDTNNGKCKNDISQYVAVNQNLLYTDSSNKIYLKVNNIILDNPIVALTDCHKLPFVFINEIGLIDDSIASIEKIIDIESFVRIEDTSHYYRDKNRVYYFRTNPVTYPNFYEIQVNESEIYVIDAITIRDKAKTYRNGILVE